MHYFVTGGGGRRCIRAGPPEPGRRRGGEEVRARAALPARQRHRQPHRGHGDSRRRHDDREHGVDRGSRDASRRWSLAAARRGGRACAVWRRRRRSRSSPTAGGRSCGSSRAVHVLLLGAAVVVVRTMRYGEMERSPCPSSRVRRRECSSSCRRNSSRSSACSTRSAAASTFRLPAGRDAGVRADRRAADEVGRRDREAGLLRPVDRLARARQPPGAGAALRSHRAARALRREHEHQLELPVPALPDPARLSRRARAEGPLPRVLSVRHRRDRQGHAAARVRRRAAGA